MSFAESLSFITPMENWTVDENNVIHFPSDLKLNPSNHGYYYNDLEEGMFGDLLNFIHHTKKYIWIEPEDAIYLLRWMNTIGKISSPLPRYTPIMIYIYEFLYHGFIPSLFKEQDSDYTGEEHNLTFTYFLWADNDREIKKGCFDINDPTITFKYQCAEFTDRLRENFQKWYPDIRLGSLHLELRYSNETLLDFALLLETETRESLNAKPKIDERMVYSRVNRESRINNARRVLLKIDENIRKTRDKNIKRIKQKFKEGVKEYTSKKQNLRWKWQDICRVVSNASLDQDELRSLAIMSGIPEHMHQSKRELCTEFAKKMEEYVKFHNKIVESETCLNPFSSITMTSIEDIPPEFLYVYQHDNRTYCDDIREIGDYVKGNDRHPMNGATMKEELIKRIDAYYKILKELTKTMDDFNNEQIIETPEQKLARTGADFISKLYYPNDLDLFLKSGDNELTTFMLTLMTVGILGPKEISEMNLVKDLTLKKQMLLDILVKRTDRSDIYEISDTYNTIFVPTEETRRDDMQIDRDSIRQQILARQNN